MYASHGGDQGKRGGVAEVVTVGEDLNIGVSPGFFTGLIQGQIYNPV